MSGIASGIGKIFATVTNSAVKIGQAVAGVGSTLFTAGASSGAGPMAAGGLSGLVQSFTGKGVLGNILTGAIGQAGFGALAGGAIGALTGQGFGKGALMGGLTGAVTGGLGGLAGAAGLGAQPQAVDGITTGSTPTGMVPTGSTGRVPSTINATQSVSGAPQAAMGQTAAQVAASAPSASGGFMGGLGKFLTSETGGGLIAGLGKGLGAYMDQKAKADESQKDRDFIRDKEQRLQDSYNVDPASLPGNGYQPPQPDQSRPTPTQKYARRRYSYDPIQGRIVMQGG